MSKYTISIYELEKLGFDFGLKEYPIFDESYREVLNGAILDFYRWREIGYETPIQFRERLNARMNLIMRNKYNKLYEAKTTEFNPLYNIELHESYTREQNVDMTNTVDGTLTSDGSNTTSGRETSGNKAIQSDMPSEEMLADNLESNLFVNGLNRIEANTTNDETMKNNNVDTSFQKSKDNGKTVETFTHTTQGSSAGLPFSKALIQLKQYLDKFELDKQVCLELGDLFFGLW